MSGRATRRRYSTVAVTRARPHPFVRFREVAFRVVPAGTAAAATPGTACIAFVTMTLGLWAVNGVLRTSYIERLPAPGAGSAATGIFGSTVAAPRAPAGLSPVETGIAITLVSWFLYLLSVGVVYAQATPARRRGKELRQARDAAEKRIERTAETVEAAHREYLRRRSALESGKLVAVNEEASARIEEDHEGLVSLEGTEGLGGR